MASDYHLHFNEILRSTVDFQRLSTMLIIFVVNTLTSHWGYFMRDPIQNKRSTYYLAKEKKIYIYTQETPWRVLLIGRIWITSEAIKHSQRRMHRTKKNSRQNTDYTNFGWKRKRLAFWQEKMSVHMFIYLFFPCVPVHTMGLYLVKISRLSVSVFLHKNIQYHTLLEV